MQSPVCHGNVGPEDSFEMPKWKKPVQESCMKRQILEMDHGLFKPDIWFH